MPNLPYLFHNMAYIGVEFSENNTVGLVHASWFSPLKHEVFWPPYKTSSVFNKALTSGEEPNQSTWKLSHVKRKFFECDDIKKAQRKLKRCEVASDIQSSDLSDIDNFRNKKRMPLNARRWSSSYSDSENDLNGHPLDNQGQSSKLLRPSGLPQLNKSVVALPGNSVSIGSSTSEPVEPDKVSQGTSSLFISNKEPLAPTGTPIGNVSANISLEIIYKEVRKLREEVKEVKAILKQSRSVVSVSMPSDLPVALPLKDYEHFQLLDEYLSSQEKLNELASYLASLGGNGITGLVNRMLRTILTNKLATLFNFAGQRSQNSNKKPFGTTRLNMTIIRGVQTKYSSATQSEVEQAVKVWLKHARQRMQKAPVAPVNDD